MAELKENLKNNNERKPAFSENTNKFDNTEKFVDNVCKSLSEIKYNPLTTIDIVKGYISNRDEHIDRILYSKISYFIFSKSEEENDIFTNNLEILKSEILKKKYVKSKDCCEIVFKIYDHSCLALSQIDNTKEILVLGVEESQKEVNKALKGIEREYITILGIFASIILTFVGGITFSSSVLKNIDKASIYRLLLIVLSLGFILVNLFNMLLNFIVKINQVKDIDLIDSKHFNYACLIISGLICVAWAISKLF